MYGPLISCCWMVTAFLDIIDGPLARESGTCSSLGERLDHQLLDPLGVWLALLGARSAFPEWDALWSFGMLRSLWPLYALRPHSIPLTIGPVAWVLVLCGFMPLVTRVFGSIFIFKQDRNQRLAVLISTICWYVLLLYCTVLLVSYPISYEDDMRWDKIARNFLFGPVKKTK